MDSRNKGIVSDAASTRRTSKISVGSSRNISSSEYGPEDSIETSRALKITTSSQNSQSTSEDHDDPDDPDDPSTPPTSTSDGFSSQSTNLEGCKSQLSQLSQVAAVQLPLSDTSIAQPMHSTTPTAGHKRTADGRVKPLSASPDNLKTRGHSRNTSAVSNASSVSRIGEVSFQPTPSSSFAYTFKLSSELRTRLTYAMVKVNKGWEANSIDEVESLASQAGSPTSSTSTLHGRRSFVASPRAAIATLQAQPSTSSQLSQDFDLYPRGDQPSSQTYESFWRSHSTPNYPTQQQAARTPIISPPAPRPLAPPADIHPAVSSRRSGTPKFSRSPNMPSHASNSPYNTTSAPRTPLRTDLRENTIVQTPIQKSIQEQDAIATLLFMSSPGNSGNMGHSFPPPVAQGSAQNSPLRSELSAQNRVPLTRRVEFGPTAASLSAGSSEGAEYRSKVRSQRRSPSKVKSDEMNRFLDEMRDSSSDEEDIVLKYSSPGRVATGRV